MDIPNKNTETVDWFLGTNLRYSEDIQLVYKEEQVLRLYYGLGPMPGSEEPFDVDGKNAWDGSSIEEIAAIFDNTQEEIENLKCDAVLKLTKMFLTHMHENNEDGEVEYDLTFPSDPNFPSEDQTSPNPTKTSILDFLDFNSKEQFSESCDKFMKELIS